MIYVLVQPNNAHAPALEIYHQKIDNSQGIHHTQHSCVR